jgi:thioredoxin reductase
MFNRGKKRIEELEKAERYYNTKIDEFQHDKVMLERKIDYLLQTIRKMDEQIYNMGQRTNWEDMRKHFQDLHEQMLVRKKIESDRIGSLIEGELRKGNYNKFDQQQIGHDK